MLFREKELSAWLLASQLTRAGWSATLRVERVSKDELFAPTDMRHSTVYGIAKYTLGAERVLVQRGALSYVLGAATSTHGLPNALRADYGRRPTSWLLYLHERVTDDRWRGATVDQHAPSDR